jgi:hypothetical protein
MKTPRSQRTRATGNASTGGQGRAPIAKLLATRQFGNALVFSLEKPRWIGQGAAYEK